MDDEGCTPDEYECLNTQVGMGTARGEIFKILVPPLFKYVTFLWMTCSFIWLATLQFETNMQKYIRMGITIFKIFISRGISLDIKSYIMFCGFAHAAQ